MLLAAILAVSCRPIADSRTPASVVAFAGVVERGATFVYTLSPTLTFRLIPLGEDWEIWVGDLASGDDNYAQWVTPPLYGVNVRQIQGWHFRNQENSGPNAPGAENVNAPQHIRPFCFTLSRADHDQAMRWWNEQRSSGLVADTAFDFATGVGLLTITELVLGNLTVGEQAWIERMAFHVEIDTATPCPPF